MKLDDLVEIEWEDHCSNHPGWVDPTGLDGSPVICRSVGYVIKLSKKYVTIAPTLDWESKFSSGASTRIRSCITKVNILKGLK